MKELLLLEINQWLDSHENPYDQSLSEKVYWTITDMYSILKTSTDDNTIKRCSDIFNRSKHLCR